MRSLALAALLCLSAAPVLARTVFPEIMSKFDLAQQDCQKGDVHSCAIRDRAWNELRRGGYNFVIDHENPNGYAWR